MMTLYWAYGSNLNVRQMRVRCPGATVVAPLVLPDAVLRFRAVADVAYLRGAECPGGLWEITDADERVLDHYEGINRDDPALGLYTKKTFAIELDGEKREVLYYQMNEVGIMPPSVHYLASIAEGYRDFGLDLARLQRAVDHSWRRKRKTSYLRWRHQRKGMPKLARTVRRGPIARDLTVPRDEGPYVYEITECDSPLIPGWYWCTSMVDADEHGPYRNEDEATNAALRSMV